MRCFFGKVRRTQAIQLPYCLSQGSFSKHILFYIHAGLPETIVFGTNNNTIEAEANFESGYLPDLDRRSLNQQDTNFEMHN
jgi:hypothetical protein